MAVRQVLVFVAAAHAVACSRDNARTEPFVVRDSSGVAIAESTRPLWNEGEGWRVSATPTVSIGITEGDPDYQLHRVMGAALLSDGRIVIANSGSYELRFYGAGGEYLSKAGRQGEGPGEFIQIAQLDVIRGDTIVVFDGVLRRVSTFDASGKFVRSFELPSIDERTFPRPRGGVFDDGSLLAYVERPAEPATVMREPGLFYRISAADTIPAVIGEFPIRGWYADTVVGSVRLPFEPHSWPVAAGEVFYLATGGEADIGIYSQEGAMMRRVRWRRELPKVERPDVDAFVQDQIDRIENPEVRAQQKPIYEAIYGKLPVPAYKPAFSDVAIDPESNIWAAEYRPPGTDLDTWFVFNSEGRLLGRVDLPQGITVFHIGAHAVIGRIADELGVERVVVHSIDKTE